MSGLHARLTVAEIAVLEGGRVQPAGRADLSGRALVRQRTAADEVVFDAMGATHALVRARQPHVHPVVVAYPAAPA